MGKEPTINLRSCIKGAIKRSTILTDIEYKETKSSLKLILNPHAKKHIAMVYNHIIYQSEKLLEEFPDTALSEIETYFGEAAAERETHTREGISEKLINNRHDATFYMEDYITHYIYSTFLTLLASERYRSSHPDFNPF